MNRSPRIRLANVVMGLSSALDLVNWFIVDHHRQVTTISAKIAARAGFSDEERSTLAVAAALHDIGAISFNEKFDPLSEAERKTKHAELGYHLLSSFRPFVQAADMIRFHHVPWDSGRGHEHEGREVPVGSHILQLADRIAVLIRRDSHVLQQAKGITETIRRNAHRLFMPELVETFLRLAEQEAFWMDAVHADANLDVGRLTGAAQVESGAALLKDLSELFRMIIDFRSPLTATHSKDVAHLSAALGRLCGFSEEEAGMLYIAGNLHDLGKLAVPVDILEKAGPLTTDEMHLMRSHTYHTHRILNKIEGLEDLALLASLHHECLDGSGYPFRFSEADLPLGSRIVAVADCFAAITENRTYRKAMDRDVTLEVIRRKGDSKKLDAQLVALVERHYQDLLDVRAAASDEGLQEFRRIRGEAEAGGS